VYSYHVVFCCLFLTSSSAVEVCSRMTSRVYIIHTVTLKKRNLNNTVLYRTYRCPCLVLWVFQLLTSLQCKPRPFLKGRALAQSARKELLATRSTKNPNPTSWVGPTIFLRPGSSPRPPTIITKWRRGWDLTDYCNILRVGTMTCNDGFFFELFSSNDSS